MQKRRIVKKFAFKEITVSESLRSKKWTKVYMESYFVEQVYKSWPIVIGDTLRPRTTWKKGWKNNRYFKKVW